MADIKNALEQWRAELVSELAVAEKDAEQKNIDFEFLVKKIQILNAAVNDLPHGARDKFKEKYSSEKINKEADKKEVESRDAKAEYLRIKQELEAVINAIDKSLGR